jgi:hypothetical protein
LAAELVSQTQHPATTRRSVQKLCILIQPLIIRLLASRAAYSGTSAQQR